MNDEILSGLKNAKERGFSIESAAVSFINAGYNQNEVQEAVSFLAKGFAPLPPPIKETTVLDAKKIPPISVQQNKPEVAASKQVSPKTIWIALIIIGLVFLGAVISLILFPAKFASLVDKILP